MAAAANPPISTPNALPALVVTTGTLYDDEGVDGTPGVEDDCPSVGSTGLVVGMTGEEVVGVVTGGTSVVVVDSVVDSFGSG